MDIFLFIWGDQDRSYVTKWKNSKIQISIGHQSCDEYTGSAFNCCPCTLFLNALFLCGSHLSSREWIMYCTFVYWIHCPIKTHWSHAYITPPTGVLPHRHRWNWLPPPSVDSSHMPVGPVHNNSRDSDFPRWVKLSPDASLTKACRVVILLTFFSSKPSGLFILGRKQFFLCSLSLLSQQVGSDVAFALI